MPRIVCPECGMENPPDIDHCQACGASLGDVKPVEIPHDEELERDDLDFIPDKDQDLPDLLQNLKKESNQDSKQDSTEEAPPNSSNGEQEEENSSSLGPTIPDWLDRIRRRAQEEDSRGDMIQRISAQQDSLERENLEAQHESFESWIQKLREQAWDKAAGRDVSDQESFEEDQPGGEDDPAWLKRLRNTSGELPAVNGEENPPDIEGDKSSLPDWLVNLGDSAKEGDEFNPDEETLDDLEVTRKISLQHEENGAGQTQKISTGESNMDDNEEEASPSVHVKSPAFVPVKVKVSREQRNQADILSALMKDERATRPVRRLETKSNQWLFRLIVGILLVAVLSLALFTEGVNESPEELVRPHSLALAERVNKLPEGAQVLLIFDYQPAFAGEINFVAEPLLGDLLEKKPQVSTLSTSFSGQLLGRQLLESARLAKNIPEEDMQVKDLGYFPMEAFAALNVTMGGGDGGDNISKTDLSQILSPSEAAEILILADSYESARIWIEQLAAFDANLPINLLVTSQAGPLLMPYWDSGQVTGMLAGFSDAAGFSQEDGNESKIAKHWRAYQAGVLILVALMALGLLLSFERPSGSDQRGAV